MTNGGAVFVYTFVQLYGLLANIMKNSSAVFVYPFVKLYGLFENSIPQPRCLECSQRKLAKEYETGKKSLSRFTKEELSTLSLKYLVTRVTSTDLLEVWSKLPREYTNKFELQVRLPCHTHYNRPEWVDHMDGPPPAQADCKLCNTALECLKKRCCY